MYIFLTMLDHKIQLNPWIYRAEEYSEYEV